ncbi:hypothetical protein KO481_15730 [Nocardia sp. NEAU-G5]|uniref:WXG100 family type VII secretion target n=1 Tax=Nocardia albiluteola TaxID=2842303 RepID=A0ABS6B147_9NOCA|nr:hypothetical protein [Nocardia albiluteola]MBU3062968.1 hypothetical protein [Nocardia albiluteola]
MSQPAGDHRIDPEQHAALTAKYGGHLDELAETIHTVSNLVAEASSTGIRGEFSTSWSSATKSAMAEGMKAQAALKDLKELLDHGRGGYTATEAESRSVFVNLPRQS